MKCLNCGEEHLIEGYDFCCQACELEHNAGEIMELNADPRPKVWKGNMRELVHTYKLKCAKEETMMYGVIVNAVGLHVKTWWEVPSKYKGIVFQIAQDEYIDFMAETGFCDVNINITASRTPLAAPLDHVVFRLKADLSSIEEYFKRPPSWHLSFETRLLYLMDLRRVVLNDAANEIRYIKQKFQDYVRKHYYTKRLAG